MEGPFQLAESVINLVVTQAAPAVYLIRRIAETESYAHYKARIERADNGNLKDELKKWIGSNYRVFWFDYVKDADTAFHRQCILWHEMGGPAKKLDNERHPMPSEVGAFLCPVCSETNHASLKNPSFEEKTRVRAADGSIPRRYSK